ncbi:hypothetical protein IPJ72_05805 [Candidatus Peregrinibacteria bacterium]|nr:MAG: hypothetical protein IPJ72_05805 [Candidatus Peregrinibacteria bacterium]
MNCKNCQSSFTLNADDQRVLDKFKVPASKLCSNCRKQRLMAFRNEMNFHKTQCGLTGKPILTHFPPDRGYTIYSSEAFYGDQWDPCDFGRDIDFNRPFFDQVQELYQQVPHLNLIQNLSQNADYTNFTVRSKDAYLSARIGDTEKAYYTYLALDCYNLFDGYFLQRTQNAYEAIDCSESNNISFSQRLKTCNDVHFSIDCTGLESCFGCVGLRHKKYHFFNQPLSKEQYEKAMSDLNTGSYAVVQKIKERFYKEEALKHPMRATVIENSENATGSYIYNSRNIENSFDVSDSEDVRNSWGVQSQSKDIYETYATYFAEQVYESVSLSSGRSIHFSYASFNNSYDLWYCMESFNNVQHCFGSVGLKQKQYCILNKQYSKEDYEALVPKLIEHMKKTGEWGEFFPMSMSPFAYNESVAGEYFPLTQAQVEAKGLYWREEIRDPTAKTYHIPDDIKDVQDDILEAVLSCEVTGRPYKIIPQELSFYRENHIPIPRRCPYQRHIDRIKLRMPRKLFDRMCAHCQSEIKTTYSPERPEQVVCEKCYLKQVY